ncbi:hypothetical protein A3X38_26055 [Salmonella enterica subsp. enterica serovar Florida]|nr:hypothetical protein [Salmonella enterica subsp. enterica serovar Florida]EDZ5930662.1 hypothetical protein [Salmonella enterica]EIU0126917.1 hypothetical protein [Salmonella enterica]EIX3595841.1 hypothetical protein [Salmonella enterica]ELB8008985.1 hypothetical protein [Salmonella enterica]
MSVKVVFDITHTKDGIDVKSEIVDTGQRACVCEVAFATQAVEEITTIARKINEAVNADPTLSWRPHAGGVH